MKRRPIIFKILYSNFEKTYFVNKHELNKYKLFNKKQLNVKDLQIKGDDGISIKGLEYFYQDEIFLFDYDGEHCCIVDRKSNKAFDEKGMFYYNNLKNRHGLRKNKKSCSFHWKNKELK